MIRRQHIANTGAWDSYARLTCILMSLSTVPSIVRSLYKYTRHLAFLQYIVSMPLLNELALGGFLQQAMTFDYCQMKVVCHLGVVMYSNKTVLS